MTDDDLLQKTMHEMSKVWEDILKTLDGRRLELLSDGMSESMERLTDFGLIAQAVMQEPEILVEMQQNYWNDLLGLWTSQMQHALDGTMMPIGDKRFKADEWMSSPFFNAVSQHYLLYQQHIQSLLEHLDFGDPKVAKRVRFFTKQYLEAISPDNFIQSNPQLMAETLQSHGKNLLLGLQNLLKDFDAGSSRLVISMTDKNAFKVGENIAITPGKVVYRNEMIELIQYTPTTAKVKSMPLLMIPPWINKYYILDLSPNNSMVRWLVAQGITVFMISWVNPDGRYANRGLEDYMEQGAIAAIRAIQTQMQVKQVNALGFCIGGTLLAMLLAYFKAKHDDSVHSATFLASLIDFSDPGDISVFIDEQQISKIERHMKKKGYLEGQYMASAFNSLRSSDLIWAFFIRNYLHGKPPVPFDLLFWNGDSTNMPAKMHSEYLRSMYLNNDLIKPGSMVMNQVPIDIAHIDLPVFFVSTQKDHIAPWKTTYTGFQMMQGAKRFILGGSGHIAGIVIPPGTEKYGYHVNLNAAESPEAWLAQSKYKTGSWWPEWLAWLKKHSGRMVVSPDVTTMRLKPLMDAPGSYVLKGSNDSES